MAKLVVFTVALTTSPTGCGSPTSPSSGYRAATRHSARRSHAAFLALGEDACAAAWEMDTVEGAREDSACLLTLLHRPSRLQLALPLAEKTAGCVADAC